MLQVLVFLHRQVHRRCTDTHIPSGCYDLGFMYFPCSLVRRSSQDLCVFKARMALAVPDVYSQMSRWCRFERERMFPQPNIDASSCLAHVRLPTRKWDFVDDTAAAVDILVAMSHATFVVPVFGRIYLGAEPSQLVRGREHHLDLIFSCHSLEVVRDAVDVRYDRWSASSLSTLLSCSFWFQQPFRNF